MATVFVCLFVRPFVVCRLFFVAVAVVWDTALCVCVCLCVRLFVCLCVCLFVYLFVCWFVCLFLSSSLTRDALRARGVDTRKPQELDNSRRQKKNKLSWS